MGIPSSLEDISNTTFCKALVAEAFGTMLLVIVGIGSCAHINESQPPTVVQISFTFGLAVASIVWCIAHCSGGHINPAVTVGLLVIRKISVVRALFYIICQCLGAIIGAAIIYGLTPETKRENLGASNISKNVTQAQGVFIEFFMTFLLVFTVCATVDRRRKDLKGSGPLAIGLAVTAGHLSGIPYTGASMNPARSFGPAVVTGMWNNHWIYWMGPILGGVCSALLYEFVFGGTATLHNLKKCFMTSKPSPPIDESDLSDKDDEIKELSDGNGFSSHAKDGKFRDKGKTSEEETLVVNEESV